MINNQVKETKWEKLKRNKNFTERMFNNYFVIRDELEEMRTVIMNSREFSILGNAVYSEGDSTSTKAIELADNPMIIESEKWLKVITDTYKYYKGDVKEKVVKCMVNNLDMERIKKYTGLTKREYEVEKNRVLNYACDLATKKNLFD